MTQNVNCVMNFPTSKMILLLPWTCYMILGGFCLSNARADHVTSSTYKLTSLVQREKMLLDHLAQVAQLASTMPQLKVKRKQIQKLNETIDILRRRHAPLQEDSSALKHPVVAFRYIRRLKRDWDAVLNGATSGKQETSTDFIENNLNTMSNAISNWRAWPTSSSVKDAALGLIRISHIYSLYPAPHKHYNLTQSCTIPEPCCNTSDNTLANTFGIEDRCIECESNDAEFCSRFEYMLYRSTRSLCNKSCYSRHDRFKPNKADHHVPPCIPQPMVNERRQNIEEVFNAKARNNARSQKKNSGYFYNSLSSKDFHFIADVAWHSQFCEEAKVWAKLAKLSQSAGGYRTNIEDWELAQTSREFDQNTMDLAPLNEILNGECPEGKDLDSYNDKIQMDYINLCRKSSEDSPKGLASKQHCRWLYTWPYVRFDEELISSDPPLSRFYNVISSTDMGHIKGLAHSQLKISELSSNAKENIQDVRVSQTAWLPHKTPTLQKLSRLVGDMTGLDTSFSPVDTPAEVFQVVNYGLGGLYAPHEDSVRTSRDIGAETSRQLKDAGDRMATWMFYLSDVQLGGATVFPVLNISVVPVKGSAVLWYNLLRNGEPDTRLIHAGCPVAVGDKWVANKWIRERGQVFRRPCSLNPLQ